MNQPIFVFEIFASFRVFGGQKIFNLSASRILATKTHEMTPKEKGELILLPREHEPADLRL